MDNCLVICKRLLDSLGVRYTQQILKEKILSHPQYPSLLSISDALEEFGVESIAANLGPDRLDDFPLPVLVQVSRVNGKYFNVITSVSQQYVSLFDEKGKQKDIARVDFLMSWTGVSLLVEAKENASELEIKQKILNQSIIKGVATVCTISLLVWLGFGLVENGTSGLYLVYFLLKLLGLSISLILLYYQHDKDNMALQKFCSGGKRMDCNSVLDSKNFHFLDGRLNLSLLSFAYFFAGAGLLAGLAFSSVSLLGWLSLASIPVVIYAFYYQAIVIKKWCKICLLIQGVLVMEVLIFFGGDFRFDGFDEVSCFLFLFLFTGVILGGIFIQPMLGQEEEYYRVKRELSKFKTNKELFDISLSRSKKIRNMPQGLGVFLKGEHPRYHVIKVCNPYCGPCARVHPILENLFDKGNIDLQILFSPSYKDERRRKMVGHLLAIQSKDNSKLMRKALDDWYGAKKKDYQMFAFKYPLNDEFIFQEEKVKDMEGWCNSEKISRTPTLFINGYELPKEYSVEDLKNLLV
ncbi:peptidase C39-like protein [Algoriphagus ratkowskyi]|uniref:Peptidase C39-like protein n=1 Tax=Algoriphagus ratkowskyi TaxID=57028 RepID=A0A2W7QL03_9BACT|nr:vitamin K epoxide reductase family protein [Algoriphagus ratkowskyi]PZX49103.1 peptidase C39-like protein [Algoriphagus ratkowskyi]TXD75338.1 VKOR family protein [Algoriphagus ratkowskyi]